MSVDIGLIFTAVEVGRSIAEFVGILDSIEAKIDRLVRSELNAGIRSLEQAACDTPEQASLMRDARSCFNRAVTLETGYRRVIALLGLSLCHHWLKDQRNGMRALGEILQIDPVRTSHLVVAGMTQSSNPFRMMREIRKVMERQTPLATRLRGFFDLHPFVRGTRLLLLGRPGIKEIRREFVLDAVARNDEAKAIMSVQEGVSRYTGRPIRWLKALE